jgi:hypothetical protein
MENTVTLTQEEYRKVLTALGGFLWLKLNEHNFHTREYKEYFDAGAEDAQEAYDLLKGKDNE